MVVQRLAVIVKTLNLLRSNNLFYYLSVDDRYELFSSGEDGIPYTEDDLYPQISANLITKIGLIKYELKPDTSKQNMK